MSYTLEEKKSYTHSTPVLTQAVLGAIEGLERKVLSNDPESGRIEAKFNKTIHGNVLGDRTQLELELASDAADATTLSLKIYPIDPVGRKLQFGARKGVPQKVMTWFFAHLDHQLKDQ